jgi:hypothetical protein
MEHAMDWLQELSAREEALRERLLNLMGRPEAAEIPPPADFHREILPAVQDMQAALDDYLCGRDTEERAWMNYEVRLKLPLFSHLRTLFCLVSAAEAEPAA